MEKQKPRIGLMFLILGLLFLFSIIMAAIISGSNEDYGEYNTAIIPISGVITTERSSGLFASEGASSADIVAEIKKAQDDEKVKAIIFEINSPGGSPVATDEIAQAIADARADNITTVAWIRESGASGAYWIASATDHIVANRMSVVGSIGVYGSYLDWSGLMDNYNVTYQRLVSGEYKDTGVPFKKLSSAEEAMMQAKLDKLHNIFIEEVAKNRNMNERDVRALATGEIFLGIEAIDNGLIDETGGKTQAEAYVQKQLNITVQTKEFVREKTFIETLMEAMNKNSYSMGVGIAQSMMQNQGMTIKT